MEQDRISARQLYAMLFTGLLTPAVRVLPGLTAAVADKSAWLTGLLAFPPLLAAGWAVYTLSKGEGGLAGGFRRAFGPAAGKAVTTIYMLWALFLLCLEGRLYAGRMLSAGYRAGSPAAFLLVLLALVLWMARRKLAAFARAAEICWRVVALTLGLVLLFSILDVTPGYVLPVWFSDLPQAGAAALIPVGVLSCGVFAAFLGDKVERGEDERRRGLRRLLGGCLALTLLQFGVLAQLGPGLCARLEAPFLEVARGVGLEGAFQRVESIVAALWVLSDFALLGLLTFALRHMAGAVFGESGARWAPWAGTGLAFAGGMLLFPDDFAAEMLAETVAPLGNLVLAFVLPALALWAGWLRGRKK